MPEPGIYDTNSKISLRLTETILPSRLLTVSIGCDAAQHSFGLSSTNTTQSACVDATFVLASWALRVPTPNSKIHKVNKFLNTWFIIFPHVIEFLCYYTEIAYQKQIILFSIYKFYFKLKGCLN
jgi:hypothetical protein